nr:reverse transcriptase domain-containing protein [Tanacetum cinerariifolium]
MRTRNSYYPNNSYVPIPRRQNKRRAPNEFEPEIRTIIKVAPLADNRTMEELLQAPTEGYGEAIVIPEINADHFEIKTNLLQLVQANPYHGFERENPHTHINNSKRITSTLKFRDVPNDVIKLMMFPYSLEGATRVWYDKEPHNSILTWEDLVNKFVNQFFPPSKTTHLKNEVSRFTQKFEETFREAWERFKKMLRACPHHGFTELTQIDTFYNCLNENDQDSLNVVTGGNLLRFQNQPFQAPNNQVQQGLLNEFSSYKKSNESMRQNLQIQINELKGSFSKQEENLRKNLNDDMRSILGSFFQNQASTSGTLPSNTILNPKVERETKETTDKEQTNFQGSTAHIQPPVVTIPEPDVLKTLSKPNIPYPSRLQMLREKATNQMEKFFQIFQDLHFDISFADVLLLMPKFASTIKSLLANKDKFFELANIQLNENCSAMLLKKLPKNLGDPSKFLIPCDFLGMDLSLPELTPTRMTLELADRSITRPKGVAEDVFVKVGKFHFPTDFVVVDFEADPRVPLILGRSFLRTSCALIDVYGEEITIRVNDEAEYAQEVLGFSKNSSGGNPTSTSEPIISNSSPSLTPFEGSDFILEEIEAYLKGDSVSPEIDHATYAKAKSLIEEPSKLELKDLPSHLEYAYLEGVDKLPVIIAKGLKDDEKEALLKEKTTFTCPYGTFAYRSMLFGLYNAPGTFQRAIISDRWTYFCNDKFAKAMPKYGVIHRLATAYHPQTSRQVKVLNRGLKRILERTVGENRALWSEKLEDALWGFKTAYKTPIGCTPYKLVYGKTFHLPIDLEHKAYWALKHANFDLKIAGVHRKLQLNELNELRDQAYENYSIYKEKTKKLHDSKIKNCIFNVGDRVLRFNSHLKIFSGKHKTCWSGPFTINQVFPYGTIELSQPDGPNFKVNSRRVKHYFGRD